MNHNNRVFMLSYPEILDSIKSVFFLVGILLALFVWILDPIICAVFLKEGTIINLLLNPSPREIYFRSTLSIVIIIFSFIGSLIFNRSRHSEDKASRFNSIFEDSLNEIYLFNADSLKFVQVNNAALNNLGYTMAELKNMTPFDLNPEFTPESFEKLVSPLRKNIQNEIVIETVHQRKDRSSYAVEAHIQLMTHNDETLFTVILMDITERKRVIENLQTNEERLRAIYDQSNDAIFLVDIENDQIIDFNQKAVLLLGYSPHELFGAPISMIHPHEMDKLRDFAQTVNEEKGYVTDELTCLTKSKEQIPTEISASNIKIKDKTYLLAIVRDIRERKQAEEQLSYQASHDALTGLVNRREFERRAERLLSNINQGKHEHALCFMDLDQFKVVNDTCGHAAGDEMLRQLSTLLQDTVRIRDTLARLGGDEFGVLMEYCSIDDARRVAMSLQKAIQEFQFSWEGHSFKIGVSIGLVSISEKTSSLTELLKNADTACYMAKDKGRNRIHVFHPDDSEIAQRFGEMQWVTRIHQAVEENRLCLYAQTIVALDDSNDKHYELLIRMVDEKGELILPGTFLPAAERYNLMSIIDHWVIKKAFGLLAKNPEFLRQTNYISINLSGQTLNNPEMLAFIITQLIESEIDGNKICFEITETAAISNLSMAKQFISTLKDFKCQFSLDDFGSGLSSFGYLKKLPVDYLKIDGMFVKDIADNTIEHAMVKSINEIGHVMGMKTIAEYVENDLIKGMLKEIGVNYVQGYGIGKPEPLEELLSRSNNVTRYKKSKTG